MKNRLLTVTALLALAASLFLVTGGQAGADHSGAACGGYTNGGAEWTDAFETYGGSSCKVQAVLKRYRSDYTCCYYYYGRWGSGSSRAYGTGGHPYTSSKNNCIRFEKNGAIQPGMICS